ncbi:MAG: 60 kDa chaperonin [Candidatus Moranbacteria bacterium GW2011_GWF2_34_56]|nr:MAG: 60 kDa chaperonin [Candidatus Moranbacteria bacterium GW2011_GWF1_34_10]KKP64208.1 MAG: 60 kDa chaperonin [Candidatus Moranbacteria bacterium GW2011_GWF2_34_56]HBI17585.1 chaperonin GroEL [Candidatus Moranbacteria bacterium]
MSKQIKYDADARKKIKAGIDQVADVVKGTLGPKGRNVILDKGFGTPTITNDGVSIAREIELEDRFENVGASLIKEVADKTNDAAGDGTTTSTVITQALISEGLKYVETGINPVGIRKGMEDAKNDVINILKKNSKKLTSREEIAQVATISAESEEMGKMIAGVMEEVGKDGVITVEESQTFGISKEIVRGMKFDKGFISAYMITNSENQTAEIKDAPVLITDKKISSISEILPILEKLTKSGTKDLVIISEDLSGEALATLVVNKLRGVLNVLAIKAPEFGESKKDMLEDIAVLTGAQVISEEKGMKLETIELSDLGEAQKVISSKDDTTIVGGKGKKSKIEERVSQIKKLIEKSESSFDKNKLSKRMAKLAGGVAVIKVGAVTETEQTYLKHKMDDALAATRAAVAEGIVAGGGTALVKAVSSLATKKISGDYEYQAGYNTLLKALNEPLKQIVVNAGKREAAVVLNEIVQNNKVNYGYNAKTDKFEDDMIKSGIIDPLKVTRTALENAVSVSAMLLTTEAVVTDLPADKNAQMPPMGGGGMPGMF